MYIPSIETTNSSSYAENKKRQRSRDARIAPLYNASMAIPAKLKPGDEVRIVAPSCTLPSMSWFSEELMHKGIQNCANLGLTVTEAKHLRDIDNAGSTSIAHRVEDLHAAFADPHVKALLCIRGGWNCNQLLPFLDYDLIKKNPKILCGFSDITALGNAIYAKTGLVTYSGPNFNQFGYGEKIQYTYNNFRAALMEKGEIELHAAEEWTDEFYDPKKPWAFKRNEGWWSVHEGKAEGTIIGGNLCTLNLLQGTEYMPIAKNTILFLEDDHETHPRTCDRDLTSLTQQPWFSTVRGIVIGRFQSTAVNKEFGPVTKEWLYAIIRNNPYLEKLPILANVDFGHTHPIFTFPIGGTVRMNAGTTPMLTILQH